MRGIKFKNIKRVFIKILKPVITVSLCIFITLASIECMGGAFDKVTLISAAAVMPQGAAVVVQEYFSPKNEPDVQRVDNEEIYEEISSQSVSSKEPTSSAPSEKPKNAGTISEYAFKASKTSSKIIWYEGAAFSNTSKTSNSEILKILKEEPQIKIKEGAPQVLIFHTHTTESYEMEDLGYYKSGSTARTNDPEKNMIRVGQAIVNELEAAGIEVIHDKTVYDYPSYNGAYNRSADTVKKYLEKYPSISVVLDIHRDAIEQSGGVRVKPTAVINGKKAAQVMIIAGVDDGSMNFPNWKQNMRFASALQREMETDFSGLTRAVMVCHRRYNMYLGANSLLIEVGGHANTLSEAVYSGEMIGTSLSQVIKEYGKG